MTSAFIFYWYSWSTWISFVNHKPQQGYKSLATVIWTENYNPILKTFNMCTTVIGFLYYAHNSISFKACKNAKRGRERVGYVKCDSAAPHLIYTCSCIPEQNNIILQYCHSSHKKHIRKGHSNQCLSLQCVNPWSEKTNH